MAPPPKKYRGREADLGAVINKLEAIRDELGGNEKKREEEEELELFARLKKLVAKQVQEVRGLIQQRDDVLKASGGSGGKLSVQLSSSIREVLRQAKDTHKKLQTKLSQEEQDLAKGKKKGNLTQDDIDAHTQMVELVGKHIVECENLEKKRYQRRGRDSSVIGGASRVGGTQMGEIKRNVEASDHLGDIDLEIGEGLQQLKRNDQQLDQQLEQISKGLTRLKGIAVDQSNEIKLQGVMTDQISDNMDKATSHLNGVNIELKERMYKAGGALNIAVKIVLLVVLLGLAAYLYKYYA